MCVYYVYYVLHSQSLIPFPDVWVDGNGGLRSKTTVRLVPLRALQSFDIFVSRPLARR